MTVTCPWSFWGGDEASWASSVVPRWTARLTYGQVASATSHDTKVSVPAPQLQLSVPFPPLPRWEGAWQSLGVP